MSAAPSTPDSPTKLASTLPAAVTAGLREHIMGRGEGPAAERFRSFEADSRRLAEDIGRYYPNADLESSKKLGELMHRIRFSPDLKDGDVPNMLGMLSRERLNKSWLSDQEVRDLGFLPSYIAVPERGQSRIRTYRHPFTRLHLHDYGDRWMAHEDGWPSMQMQRAKYDIEKARFEDLKSKDTVGGTHSTTGGGTPAEPLKPPKKPDMMAGLNHAYNEGVPGYLSFAGQWLRGSPTLKSYVDASKTGTPAPGGSNASLIVNAALLTALGAGLGGFAGGAGGGRLDRAYRTGVGAATGAGTAAGAGAGLLAMPYLDNALKNMGMNPGYGRTTALLAGLLGATGIGALTGRKIGRKWFSPPDRLPGETAAASAKRKALVKMLRRYGVEPHDLGLLRPGDY